MISFSPSYNRDLAQLFSAPVAIALANGQRPPLLEALASSAISAVNGPINHGEFFAAAYEHLWEAYRGEYLYKNAIARRILLGRHSLKNTRFFAEFPVEQSKLDVLLVNGSTTAYEIKTALDSLDRLPTQVASYSKAFDRVFVVTHPEMVTQVEEIIPQSVGILALSNRGSFRTCRESASHRAQVDPAVIFDCLRRVEYVRILTARFGPVPKVPNTHIYGVCRRLFLQLSPSEAHDSFAAALRQRECASEVQQLVADAPAALSALCLTAGFTPPQAEAFRLALTAPLV